jgi:hypothetical protein
LRSVKSLGKPKPVANLVVLARPESNAGFEVTVTLARREDGKWEARTEPEKEKLRDVYVADVIG